MGLTRRRVLGALATAGMVGPTVLADRDPGTLNVSLWLSERASTYDRIRRRVSTSLRYAMGDLFETVDLSWRGTVSVPTQNAYTLMVSGEWPVQFTMRTVADERLPGELNLLVTDGDITDSPTGLGLPTFAAVGGAKHLARMPPADRLGTVVDFSRPALAVQLLLHEAGHALGLGHYWGSITDEADHAVVSPMVSTYPWESTAVRKRQFDRNTGACGDPFPDVSEKRPRLSLRYADCIRRGFQDGFI